jgi:hypothetical protein
MARPLTEGQRRTLQAVLDARVQPGEEFLAQEVFPMRNNVDNAHRRTLAALVALGVLERSGPAWATRPQPQQTAAKDKAA